MLNTPEKNIITIEDPVEYQLDGITQMQVNPRAGLTFANGLRAMMRADPDVIMVGEIRDRETAQIAVESALTGHLVLSTLHTNDAPTRDHPPHRDGHRAVPRRLARSTASSPSASRATLCKHCKKRDDRSPPDVLREQRLQLATSTSRPTSPAAAAAAAAPATRAGSASTRS